MFAEDEASLLLGASDDADVLERLVAERCAGAPLEHVLGWAEFGSVRVQVDPGVFVPRPRSELLVACACQSLRPGDTLIELCCGTAAIGLAVSTRVGGVVLHACDIDPVAVACARRNLEDVGGHVYLGDLDAPLPSALLGRADAVIANAPYVPTAAIPLLPREARDHEPQHALDGGTDGLDLHRRIAGAAPRWLVCGGRLLIETSEMQADQTAQLMAGAGFTTVVERSEEDDATVVIGTLG